MSDAAAPPVKRRRRGRLALLIVAGFVLLVAGLAALTRYGVLLPQARLLIEARTDGLKIGRFGRLKIYGLSGDIWRDFQIRRLTISDDKGVWLDATGLRLRWRYEALLARSFRAEALTARHVLVLRRPLMEPSKPSPGMPISFDIDSLKARVEMAEAFSYRRGVYDLSGGLDVRRRNGGQSGDIQALSVLHPGDHLKLKFQFGGQLPLLVRLDAVEARGGALAGAMGLPADQTFSLQADASGSKSQGRFSAHAVSGASRPLDARGAWTPQGGQAEGRMSLTASRLTKPLADKFGPEAAFAVTGHKAPGDLFDLTGKFTAEYLDVEARGRGDVGERRIGPQGLAVTLTSRETSHLLKPPQMGAGRVEGVLTGDWADWTLAGRAQIADVVQGGYRLARVSGPITVGRKGGVLTIHAQPLGAGGYGEELLGAVLGATPRGIVEAQLLKDGRWLIRDLDVTGSAVKVKGTGDRTILGALTFQGRMTVTDLRAVKVDANGTLTGSWRARQADPKAPWLMTLEGHGEKVATGFAEVDRLLGPAPRVEAKASWFDSVFSVERATLTGQSLRAGTSGQLKPPGVLAFKVDWAADGPFRAGPVEISGNPRGEGAFTGTVDAPKLDLISDVARIDIPSLPLTDAKVILSFMPREDGSVGTIAVQATSAYGPANGRADFRFPEGGVQLSNIAVDGGGVRAQGALALQDDAPSSADLTLAIGRGALLDNGAVSGRVKLVDAPGGAQADVALRAENAIPRGARFAARTATLTAQGPMSRLPYRLTAAGASAAGRWTLDGSGVLAQRGTGYAVSLDGSGRLGERDLRTTEAAQFAFDGPVQTARLRLASSGGGRIEVDSRLDQAGADIRARLAQIDLQILDEDLAGRVDADLTLQGKGSALAGTLDARLDAARGRGADPSQGLNGILRGRLADTALTIDADVTNQQGLKANTHLVLPAEASASPLRLAIDRRRPVSGQFLAEGEVKPLWDLLVGGERSLSGQVAVQGRLGGTLADPTVTGQASVDGGRFDDAATGLALREVTLRATFAETTVNVTQASGGDGRGGTLSGQGRISLHRNGASTFRLDLDNFRLLDNEIATATASGPATLDRGADGKVRLGGDLTILRADVAAEPPTPSGVVPMDVVEKNQPLELNAALESAPRPGPAIALDVTLKAPRRIYLRGRGLDLEVSLDARVTGTSAAPVLSGMARVVQGEYDFAGKRFEFDDRGVVYLSTNPAAIRLDLTATRDDPSLTAVVRIRGTAEKPEITLTSTPVLPNDEVLSQVLFGRSASQLSPLEAAQLASALSALAGGGGFDVIGGLRNFAGLDRLALVGGDESGASVAGGKYLSEDIYLELIGGGRTGPSAQVEWRVNRRLSLTSRLTGQGDTRLAVRWRRDY